MHGNQLVVDQPKFLQSLKGTKARFLALFLNLVRGFMQMKMHGNIELIGQHMTVRVALHGLVRQPALLSDHVGQEGFRD